MRVNIRVENFSVFKYVGCATVAMMLYEGLQKTPGVEVELNSKQHDHDITHCHTLGPGAVYSRMRAKHVKVLTAHSTPSLNVNNLARRCFAH